MGYNTIFKANKDFRIAYRKIDSYFTIKKICWRDFSFSSGLKFYNTCNTEKLSALIELK